jgi:protein-disulfide isomerase
MRRVELAILFVLGVVAGSVGSAWYFRQAPVRTDRAAVESIVDARLAKVPKPAPGLDAAGVKSIVAEMIAADDAKVRQNSVMSVATLDPKTLDPLIEKFLMSDPTILQRMNDNLAAKTRADQQAQQKQAIAANASAIFDDPENVVLGNPHGDVTLVEMFDYNCSFCRGALPDLATLLSTDKNLKVELKQFPILTAGSVDAARVALEVAKSGKDYWTFHTALYTSRGEVTAQTALDEAKALGLDPEKLKTGMQDPSITAAIQSSFDLAQKLNLTGTPTYIIGDEIIPGAVPLDQLKTAIANMRACGSAVSCPVKQS